ncbi:MAG TPA: hypothetical protein VNT30_17295 [Stellaceae bacterium]|nr:hypothetical protein [Stellaceae bacterium]
MSEHKYKSGQTVQIDGGARGYIPVGAYKVVSPMPSNGTEVQYRVKSVKDGHERVVQQSQIGRVGL